MSTTRTWSSTRGTRPPAFAIRRRASFRCRPRPDDRLPLRIRLAGIALALVGARALPAQFGLVQLPLADPAYVQLTALEHMGCEPARVASHRPYEVRAVRSAIARATTDPRCRGVILDVLRQRFAVREADATAGLRAGAAATLRLTGESSGEFEPMWKDIRATSQGDPTAVGIVHGRLTWGDGSGDHVVAVGDAFAQTDSRNDPTLRARQFRHTSGVIDFSEAYLSGRLGLFEGTIGRGQEAWLGEGTESLVLSANGPPMDRIAGGFATDAVEARVLLGALDDVTLDSAQDGVIGGPQPQRYYRYLAAGQVTWHPSRTIDATVGQLALVPVGSRTLDLYYVNPAAPFPDTSRTLADVTTHLATFGAVHVRAGPATLGGEVLADGRITADQLAYQVSASAPIPTHVPVSVMAAYTHIGASVYESQFYASVLERYNAPIGSALGPNAEYGRVGAEVFAAGALRISGDIGIWRRGRIRIDERPSEPFPPAAPDQRATVGNLGVQFLTPVIPVTLRFQAARVTNVNNTSAPSTTYERTQLIGTYAFRYP